MEASIDVEKNIIVGQPVMIESSSPKSSYAVAFEDDGETGYLYGLDLSLEENPILDALYIYNGKNIIDRSHSHLLQILWAKDGLKVALLINQYPHAVFDFEARRGYCRTNFPLPDTRWTSFDHSWSDAAIDLFND
ncbi:MAG: DUF2251 domain-containing protein [Acidobacteriota bacterium]